jgi:hypothetical protein
MLIALNALTIGLSLGSQVLKVQHAGLWSSTRTSLAKHTRTHLRAGQLLSLPGNLSTFKVFLSRDCCRYG